MLFLFLTIPLIFAFSHLFKYSQVKKCQPIPVITVNYFIVSLLLLGYYLVNGFPEITKGMLVLGLSTGCVFIIALYSYTKGLEMISVNLCMLSFRLSVVIPVIAAVILWGEVLSMSKLIGIALCLIAMVFMSSSETASKEVTLKKIVMVTLLIFILQGLTQILTQAIHYLKYDDVKEFILMLITTTAMVLGVLIMLFSQKKTTMKEIKMGAFIGVVNTVCLVMILKTLTLVSAAVFWPVSGCSLVVLDILAAHFLWKENLSYKIVLGGCFAVSSIYIILR